MVNFKPRFLKLWKRVFLEANLKTKEKQFSLHTHFKRISFHEQAKIAKYCIIYNRLQGHVPAYPKTLLKLSCETHSRQTRYANFNVACPIVKRQKEGGRTFTLTSCKLWNSLPLTTRKLPTLGSFKRSLWKNIFNNQQVLNHSIL